MSNPLLLTVLSHSLTQSVVCILKTKYQCCKYYWIIINGVCLFTMTKTTTLSVVYRLHGDRTTQLCTHNGKWCITEATQSLRGTRKSNTITIPVISANDFGESENCFIVYCVCRFVYRIFIEGLSMWRFCLSRSVSVPNGKNNHNNRNNAVCYSNVSITSNEIIW